MGAGITIVVISCVVVMLHHTVGCACQTIIETNKKLLPVEDRAKIASMYSNVIGCLALGSFLTPAIKQALKYPADAEAHYKHVLDETKRYRQGRPHCHISFCGPWIEHLFIAKYEQKDYTYFNGLIPIFIPWTDFAPADLRNLNPNAEMTNHLRTILRTDVLYFTVSQHDRGFGVTMAKLFPNILVLNAGGFGHIPIPLIRGVHPLLLKDSLKIAYEVGFIGAVNSGRSKWVPLLCDSAKAIGLGCEIAGGIKDDANRQWQRKMSAIGFQMAPRGFGRTSFRLAESLQMGRPVVYIHSGVNWTPYQGTDADISHLGFTVDVSQPNAPQAVEDVAKRIKAIMGDTVQAGRFSAEYSMIHQRVADARYLYTYEGLLDQIVLFIKHPFGEGNATASRLRCIPHPINHTLDTVPWHDIGTM